MEGGKALAYLRWNKPMAWTYCSPRQISSISFSRFAWRDHNGKAAVITIDMTARPTSNAAIA